ncbi:MAG: N(2)-fixation sustaining protein CowN [Rhodospirillales bacterium]
MARELHNDLGLEAGRRRAWPAKIRSRIATRAFIGIDCDGDSRRLIAMIRRHIDDPTKTDGFWEALQGEADPGGRRGEA